MIWAASRWAGAALGRHLEGARQHLASLVGLPGLDVRGAEDLEQLQVRARPLARRLQPRHGVGDTAGEIEREAQHLYGLPALGRALRELVEGGLEKGGRLDGVPGVVVRDAQHQGHRGIGGVLPPQRRDRLLGPVLPQECAGRGQSRCRVLRLEPGGGAGEEQEQRRPHPPRSHFAGVPVPSFSVRIWSAGMSLQRSTAPLGQRTSTASTRVVRPRPKWTRRSFCEM